MDDCVGRRRRRRRRPLETGSGTSSTSGAYSAMTLLLVIVGLTWSPPVDGAQQPDKNREDTTVDIAHYGEIKTAITTNKTKAFLSCESGDMVVTIDFKDPFYGIIYANRDPLSPCQVEGYGDTVYSIRLPLQGCGTREEPKRTFINDIVVRFRKGLIVDEDEVKTIICRYGPPVPPPVIPLTPLPPLPIEPPGVVAKPKRLTEAEIYVIMCFLLFLALLLLGIGLAYYCLKRRNIKIVRKRRAVTSPSAPASEITKLSGSTMGTLSAFDGFRIPRATAHSVTSGSEAALLTHGDHSDTMPSDYPSESPSSTLQSDTEEVETTTTTTRRDTTTIVDDEEYRRRHQLNRYAAAAADNRAFEATTPTTTPTTHLTTIYEQDDYLMRRDEYERSLLSARRLMMQPPVPSALALPPVYAEIRKKRQDDVSVRRDTLMTSDLSEEVTRMRFAPPPPPQPQPQPPTTAVDRHQWTDDYRRQTTTTTTTMSEEMARRGVPPSYEVAEDAVVPTEVAPTTRRHVLDDTYLTTVTETHSKEDVLKHIRQTVQSHIKEPPPKWDVTIRTYPPNADDDLESSGRHGAAATVTTDDSDADPWDQMSYVSERPRSVFTEPDDVFEQRPPNWDVLIRVLEPTTATGAAAAAAAVGHGDSARAPSETTATTATAFDDEDDDDDDDMEDALSVDDRERWKRIITTDTTLRTMLREARTVEELESIRTDERYERLFEPRKWDVIIRILTDPSAAAAESERAPSEASSTTTASHHRARVPRYHRKASSGDVDSRSHRSSLPPVYEDMDVGAMTPTTTRSRRTSRSSDYDLQSMDRDDLPEDDPDREDHEEEEEEEEIRYERDRRTSMWTTDAGNAGGAAAASGHGNYSTTARSVAERSTTEIVEIPRVFDPSSPSSAASSSSIGRRHHHHHHHLGHHRHLERSSTEILVNPAGLRMTAAAATDDLDLDSIPETHISDYMR